jgi:hypothetical protein
MGLSHSHYDGVIQFSMRDCDLSMEEVGFLGILRISVVALVVNLSVGLGSGASLGGLIGLLLLFDSIGGDIIEHHALDSQGSATVHQI